MQLDDLKQTWEQEVNIKTDIKDFQKLRRHAKKFDKKATLTWTIEVLLAGGLAAFFLYLWVKQGGFSEINILTHIGFSAAIICCIYVAGKILWGRKVSTDNDWTLAAQLNIQIEKRENESKLLTSTAYWYLSPILLTIILFSYGTYALRSDSYIPDGGLLLYWASCAVLVIVVYFINQYHAKHKIKPMLNQLYALREQLENNSAH